MQRLIGVSLGATVTFVLLEIFRAFSGDLTTKYATAVIIGAVVSLSGPWVIGSIFLRTRTSRRNHEIAAEVDRQMAERRDLH